MNHKGTKQLETVLLILRPFRMADADAMYRNWASDPGVTRYLTWNPHTSAEDSKQVLASWTESYSNPAYYQWAIVLKALGEPVGSISAVTINERMIRKSDIPAAFIAVNSTFSAKLPNVISELSNIASGKANGTTDAAA